MRYEPTRASRGPKCRFVPYVPLCPTFAFSHDEHNRSPPVAWPVDSQWQQASKDDPYATNNFKSCDDKTAGTYQLGTNDAGNSYCGSDTGGTTDNPQHDFSAEESENALDTNDNGVLGETFYMKLPAYDGDYDASTESGVVVECPEYVPVVSSVG
jgi:hypothetical protein